MTRLDSSRRHEMPRLETRQILATRRIVTQDSTNFMTRHLTRLDVCDSRNFSDSIQHWKLQTSILKSSV